MLTLSSLNTRRPSPFADFIVQWSPKDGLFNMQPAHQRAADWLIAMVGDVPVDDRCLKGVLYAAVSAGFNVSLALSDAGFPLPH